MAKGKKTKDELYDQYKSYHGATKRADFNQIDKVRDAYDQAKRARQNNCYWNSFSEVTTDASATGGDWELRWTKHEKIKLGWSSESGTDTYQSNVKSPMATGRINAFVNQFKKLELAWDAKPNNDNDRNKAKIASKALDWWYQTSNAKAELVKVADSAATYGSGFFRVFYLEEKRKLRFPKTKAEDMSDEEKEELKGAKRKTIWGAAKEVITKDDVAIEYIPIREMYPDGNAWGIHGVTRKARYMVRRRFIHIDDFKSMYKENPNAMNVDKVKPASSYNKADTYDFFKKPEDVIDSNSVELIEYENQIDDEYIVLANDVLVMDTPLPYFHKEISYHKVDFIKNPNQFYGIGIPDLLMNIQGAQEILINMMYDYIYRAYNLRYFIDASSFGELSEDMLRADTQLIPIDLSDGKGIGNKVAQVMTAPLGFDTFQLNELTERNGTIASGIDPSQLSLMAENKTATATMQNKEQLQSMVFAVIDNFVNEGWFYAGRQVWKLMQQFWRVPKLRGVVGDEKKKPEYKKIRLEGIEIEIDKDDDVNIKDSDQDYTFFEITEEYLDTDDDLDIMIKPDSVQIMSKSLEMQKMKEEFAQLVQFAVDPENSQAMQMHPMPMVNAPKLFQRYFDVEGLPQDLLIQPEYREEVEQKKAEDNVMRILQGQSPVDESPGATPAYRKYVARVLFAIDAQIRNLESEIEEDMQNQMDRIMQESAGMPQFDPMTGQPIPPPEPEPNPQMIDKVTKLRTIRQKLSEHLVVVNMPIDVMEEQATQPPQDPMAAGMGGMGGMGAPMPPGTDMSTPMPGMPGDMGAPPMPAPQTGMPQPMGGMVQ